MKLVNHPGVRVNEPSLAVNGGPSRPTTKVEVAFASDPMDEDQQWTDVTDWWRKSMAAEMGRANELATFQAGRLSILLDNSDRRFDIRFKGYESVAAGLDAVAHWRLHDLLDVAGGSRSPTRPPPSGPGRWGARRTSTAPPPTWRRPPSPPR